MNIDLLRLLKSEDLRLLEILNKEVQDMMTGKVGRRKSKDLIADEFRLASKGQTPSQSFVDETYKSLKRSGEHSKSVQPISAALRFISCKHLPKSTSSFLTNSDICV